MDHDIRFETILAFAKSAAKAAVKAKGPENMNALDCGFAWVTIGGNEPLARYCRKQRAAKGERDRAAYLFYGDKPGTGGWQWWNPGEFSGQAVGHKLAGAQAFQRVLGENGIDAHVSSRLD